MRVKNIVLILLVSISFSNCKKMVEVEPPIDKPEATVVYGNQATATAVLTGIYNKIATGSFATGTPSISMLAGLSADELTAYSSSGVLNQQVYQNAITSTNVPFWSSLYNYIYTTNSAIEGLTNSNSLSMSPSRQLLGEAKFMRGFFYFYLVNLFGDVPLVLSTDFYSNASLSRSPKSQVFQQIVNDLKDAQDLLSSDFVALDLQSQTVERVRPNKGAAAALLARTYLYYGNLTGDVNNYANAEAQATSVIVNTALYDTVSLNNVFLKNSKEAIWQLQPVLATWNTDDARAFILTAAPSSSQPASISSQLLNSFEVGDKRKQSWVASAIFGGNTYSYPYKYKVNTGTGPLTEYLMVFRLAEQYLIRAEARAKQGNIAGAQNDINIIRKRAGLLPTTANTTDNVLVAIEQERRTEMFTEWGHRWLDLKRTGKIDAVMSTQAPLKNNSAWASNKQLYPIPQSDILRNPNLVQNEGY